VGGDEVAASRGRWWRSAVVGEHAGEEEDDGRVLTRDGDGVPLRFDRPWAWGRQRRWRRRRSQTGVKAGGGCGAPSIHATTS
jgi:hypothetical protein